ncbi:MerR family transcriptional regulator [Solibacillus sp. CAU 1738]|uniref:MerR family transcriptional regulator n=1 Tax=Solibacillus sp. CAU 1738 TaxID=3140363 RepID=UPI003260E117
MHVDEYIDIEGLKQLFSKDRLYKEVLKDDLNEEMLFPSFIKELKLTRVYTTEEVSKMLNKKDSNIRYYINELNEYIKPMKPNRNYRYDYIIIYRIYLIILFTSSAGRKICDIKRILNDVHLDPRVQEIEVLKEKVDIVEQHVNQLNQIKKLHNERDSNIKNIKNKVHKNQCQVIEIDLKLDELNNQYFKTMVNIFETERRLLHLDNELFQGIQRLELQNRLYAIESAIHEKNKSLFDKISSVFNSGTEASSSTAESNLLVVQKEINNEKELLIKLEKEREMILMEREKVADLKIKVLKGD